MGSVGSVGRNGRWGDGEMGRWGDGEIGKNFISMGLRSDHDKQIRY
ncbi:MAG: hypothetical protein F6J98_07320 [Moorea sp. SIO4G2]|nr:hypothetical protein [Moorena sp. SIO4G2]